MDWAHKTIWRLHKNVMIIGLGLSFKSLNVVHCSLDFFKRQSWELIQQHMVIQRDWKEAVPVSGSGPDFVLPVCWWIIDYEGVFQLYVSGHLAHLIFLLTALHRCFSFSVWLFPHILEWAGTVGRAPPCWEWMLWVTESCISSLLQPWRLWEWKKEKKKRKEKKHWKWVKTQSSPALFCTSFLKWDTYAVGEQQNKNCMDSKLKINWDKKWKNSNQ